MDKRKPNRGLHVGQYLLCALAVAILAGCGGGSDSSSAAQSSGGLTSTPPSPSPPSTNSTPSISGTPGTQAQAGQAYSFTPSASDPGGGTLTFSVQNKPSWANFNTSSGELSGTPTGTQVGSYANIVISVSNGTASQSLAAFSITVAAAPVSTGAASLSWSAPTTNTDGSALTDLSGYTIDYGTSSGALTQTVTISDPTTTSYTLQGLAAGTWYFAISDFTSTGTRSALSSVVSKTIQ